MSDTTMEHNRRFLAAYDPDLLAEFGEPASSAWQVVSCAAGDRSLRRGDQWLHHPEQPEAEAVQMVQHGAGVLHLHFGLGLGWFLKADKPRHDGALLVYEPDPAVFALAMDQVDLATLLPERNAQIFLSPERYAKALAGYLKAGVEAAVFVSPYHQKLYPGAFQDFAGAYNRAHELRRHESGLDKEALPGIWASTVASLPESTQAPGAERLAGVLQDKPAVVLSAGPSLERNILELLPYRDRVVIFAIARTVPVLARYNLSPDFLVHVEAQDFVHLVQFAENLADTTFLLAEQAQRAFFQVRHGATFVFQSRFNPVTCWLNQRVPQWRKQIAATSGSVSATAFHMAVLCGCNPITLMGHDLALQGSAVYAGSEVNRAFRAAPKRLRRVPGYFGGQVTSLDHFVLTLYWYDEVVPGLLEKNPQLQLYNATGAGAAVPRFAAKSLAEIVGRWCGEPVATTSAIAASLADYQAVGEPAQLQKHLKELQKQLAALTKEARAFLSLQRDLEKRLKRAKSSKDVAALQRKLPQIDRHNQRFQLLHQQHPGLEFFFNKQWQMFKQTINAVQQRNSGRQIAPSQWVTQFGENLGALGTFWRAVQERVGYLEKTLF